ncbi:MULTISPECIES: hypothetical protein [Streptomyces]|uniref:hypothetical protein n=1 Tax=Streptomyces TaxID=1883 RepID=UPI001C4EE23B|nr:MULTISPECIES: hypothetical protein [Streptomyces]MCX4709546.1 hypothetical protein [Streptomyces griseus]QXR01803.1 hypothetical protein KV381_14875 [Streptomyces sp. WY228]
MSMMKRTSRRAAGLLTVGGVAAALLVGPVAGAQADGPAPQCAGGCPQVASSGYQVSSGAGDPTTDGNWDPH